MILTNELANIECFQHISPQTLDKLYKAGKKTKFKKNATLYRAHEPLQQIYILLSGKAVIYNLTHDGKRKILFIFGPGTLLNEHIANSHDSTFFCDLIEPGEVLAIPTKTFFSCMKNDFSLTQTILEIQEKKMWRLGHQLKNTMGSIYMERKLAAKLWKLARDFGIETPEGILIDINLPVTFLADMLGAPRETASKACKTLTQLGLIKTNRKQITLPDPNKIAHYYKTGKTE